MGEQQRIPKVSIIVPMYLCEAYVGGLMDMLCGQTLRNIEIICVVDGSPDGTLERAEARAVRDERIRVISQEHGGAGVARNTGLDAARGEYLMFLDADDLYQPGFVERMASAADEYQADMVVCRYCEDDARTGNVQHGQGFDIARVRTGVPIDPTAVQDPFPVVSAVPYNKIWRSDFIRGEGLRFSTTRVANDVFFSWASLVCARRLAFIEDELYTYRMYHSEGSLSANKGQVGLDFLPVSRQLYDWLKARGLVVRLESSYCTQWRWSLHYIASFGTNDELVEQCARVLAEDEPWAGMDGVQLKRLAGLELGLAKRELRSLQQLNRGTRAHTSYFPDM